MAVYYFRNAGVNWGDAANWSLTDGGGATGAVPTAADDALFTANSGNCTVDASNRVCKTLNFTGYTNTITMTFGITVSGNVTLAATMGVAGTAALTVNTTATLTSNGKTWSAGFTFAGTSATFTLSDDWTISGILTIATSSITTINSNKIFSSGNLAYNSTFVTSGTTTFELTGGTWTTLLTSALQNNLIINGNITISGNVYYSTGTLTYISGTVTVTGSTLNINASTTLNTSGMSWNNITIVNTGGSITLTLSSNLTTLGNFLVANGITIINGNILYVGGNFTSNIVGTNTTGTTNVVLNGTGTLSTPAATTGSIQLNIEINTSGIITTTGTLRYQTGTLTYTSGIVKANTSTLNIGASSTFINCDKINFKIITITAGATITMNRFFSGSALVPTRIQSTGSNYTITFQDGFEKITKFTKISNCTVTNRGQLLCITDKSNKGGNLGVRYINQMPNRVPLNNPSTANPLGYATSTYLLADPNTILN